MRVAALLIGALLLPAVVPAIAHAQTPGETRVWNGFMKLGMSRDKAWCYSQIIGQTLGPEEIPKPPRSSKALPMAPRCNKG